jgi:O-antigen/teichoic acid export membrane protein
MRETLKRLLKMTAGYGIVQWAGPFISFIFSPILTRILTPADYGVYDYVITVGSGVGILALWGLPQALLAHFNDRPGDAWRRGLTGSALVLTILIGLPLSFAIVFFAPQIAHHSFGGGKYTLLFQLVGAALICSTCNGAMIYAAQAALRVRWGITFSLTTILLTTFGNILFIIILRCGVLGMVLVPICSGVALSITIGFVMRPMIGAPRRKLMGQLLKSGAILLPGTLSIWILQMADRLFLVHYVTTQELGHYAIANRVAALLFVLMAPVYSAWTPLALAIQDEVDAKQRFADVARYIIAVSLTGALFLGLFATEILLVMTRAPYLPAAPYVGFLALVHVMSALGTVLCTGAMAGKQFSAISWTVFLGAAANIGLNILLIPVYGVWGATIATVIGYAIQPILLYPIVQRRNPIPYPTASLLGVIAIQVFLLIVGAMMPPIKFGVRIVLKLILLGSFPAALVATGVVTRLELRRTISYANSQLRLVRARVEKQSPPTP